jgi:uncharacterized protein (DUF427 family)
MLAKQTVLVSGQQKFVRTSQKHTQEKYHGTATYMKVTMKVFYRSQFIWHALYSIL